MTKKLQEKTVEVKNSTVRVAKNLNEFINAVALTAVTGVAIHLALQNLDSNWYKALLFAGVLISLQAFLLLVKFFNRGE